MKNSVSYEALLNRRTKQLYQYIETAKDLNNRFHKFAGYLLAMNMNLSICNPHHLLNVPEVEPDEKKNIVAVEAEKIRGKFKLKPVYKRQLQKMLDEANDLLAAEDLTKAERVYLVMFMALCASTMEGKLFPTNVESITNIHVKN